MHIPGTPLLQESDSSKSEIVNPGEYSVGTTTVDGDIRSPTERVGAICPGRRDCNIVFDATITRGYLEGETHISAKGLKFVYKRGDNLVFAATTGTGEVIEFEVKPFHSLGFLHFVPEKEPGSEKPG